MLKFFKKSSDMGKPPTDEIQNDLVNEFLTQCLKTANDTQSADQVRDAWAAEFDKLNSAYQSQSKVLTDVLDALANKMEVAAAARHMLNVMSFITKDGDPVFVINEAVDASKADDLRHAVIDLSSRLNNQSPPHFTLSSPSKN